MTFQKACETFIGKGAALTPTKDSSINCNTAKRPVSFGSIVSSEDLENMTSHHKSTIDSREKLKVVPDFTSSISSSNCNLDFKSLKFQNDNQVENNFQSSGTHSIKQRQISNPFIHKSERDDLDFFNDSSSMPYPGSGSLIHPSSSKCYMLLKGDLSDVIVTELPDQSCNEEESTYSSSISESFVTQCGEPDNLIQNSKDFTRSLSIGEKLFASGNGKQPTKNILPSSDEFLEQALHYRKNIYKNKRCISANSLMLGSQGCITNTGERNSAVLDTSFIRISDAKFLEEEKEEMQSLSLTNSTSYVSTSVVDCTQFLAPCPLFSLKATISVLNERMQQKMDDMKGHEMCTSAKNNATFSLSASMSLKSVYAELDLDPEITNVNSLPFGSPSCGEEPSDTNVSISVSILLDINKYVY